jgi:hypothetical protein
MICTTLTKIRKHGPCVKGWQKLLAHVGKTQADDEQLPLLTVLDGNGLDHATWCFRAVPEHCALWRHYAVDCVKRVAHLLTDERSHKALRVARQHAIGKATDEELAAARVAARVAAMDVATTASWSAASAAATAASMDVECAAWEAASAAATDAWAAWAAAWDAWDAWAAAWDAERAWQTDRLRKLLTDGAWSPVGELP